MWSVDSTHNSLITTGNAGDKPARVKATLRHALGSYELPERTLQPGESMWLNVRELIQDQIPDRDGNTIPPNITSGVYEFDQVDDDMVGSLYEGKLILDSTYGRATYGCANCCGYYVDGLAPNPLGIAVGFTSQDRIYVENACTGAITERTVYGYNWLTGSSSIAGVSSSGLVSAFSPGQTWSSAFISLRTPEVWNCPQQVQEVDNTVQSKPTVTIEGTKNFVFVGSDQAVIDRNLFFATGNPTGGTFSWSASGSGLSFNNPAASNVKVTSTVASASLLDKSITVNYSKNGQNAIPATRAITARMFKFLQQNVFIQTAAYNGPSQYGYEFQVTYNIFTNPGGQVVAPGVSGLPVSESVSVVSTTHPGQSPSTGAGATDANSEIRDTLALISSQPLPANLQIVLNQDLSVAGFSVRNNRLTYTSSAVSITNNGPFN